MVASLKPMRGQKRQRKNQKCGDPVERNDPRHSVKDKSIRAIIGGIANDKAADDEKNIYPEQSDTNVSDMIGKDGNGS